MVEKRSLGFSGDTPEIGEKQPRPLEGYVKEPTDCLEPEEFVEDVRITPATGEDGGGD